MDKDEAGRMAIDTVMRVAHNLRPIGKSRPLSPPECAIMAADLRLTDAGWTWTPDGPMAPSEAKGALAEMALNPPYDPITRPAGWKLHRCADGEQCCARIPGGCATGYCAKLGVAPDDAGVPRFPLPTTPK